jgi:hypothetical protein
MRATAWEFFYFGYSWAASGRTFGMAVLGVRVVRADGEALHPWRGAARAAVFPLSFLLFGLGFLGILVQREHRALHDLIAGIRGHLCLGRAGCPAPVPRPRGRSGSSRQFAPPGRERRRRWPDRPGAAQLSRASSVKCGGEEGKHPQRVKQRAPAGAIV